MIVPDANLLLYSVDSTSPFHSAAAKWWTGCLSGSVPVGLCQPVLFAFLRVSTNRRVFREPLSLEIAGDLVNEWIAHPVTRLLLPGENHVRHVVDLLTEAGSAGGDLVTDAQIAALARAHRGEVHTADHDFRRFPGVTCRYPLAA
ncbi:MAG: PIN domain-containing protein [Acidobacteria bacterium]|nr:PIN domain-containing protein [Acidobacteriota bacterium]